jgi:hypothetical protein
MEVDEVGNAPESFSSLTKNTIYQLSSDKPNTLSKLSSRYNATIKTEKPPVTVMGETDFVIILVNPPATDTSL